MWRTKERMEADLFGEEEKKESKGFEKGMKGGREMQTAGKQGKKGDTSIGKEGKEEVTDGRKGGRQ